MSGVSLPTIQNIEVEKGNPSLDVLEKLSLALGLQIRFECVPANWDLLAKCGVPITSQSKISTKPTADLLIHQLRLASAELERGTSEEETDRKKKALEATVWAIQSHHRTFYEERLEKIPAIHRLLPHPITGQHIKLRRMAREVLAQYL